MHKTGQLVHSLLSKLSPKENEAEKTSNVCNISGKRPNEEHGPEQKSGTMVDAGNNLELSPIDRYISKIHCNLDSRYQVSGALAVELRKPQYMGHMKAVLSCWRQTLNPKVSLLPETIKQEVTLPDLSNLPDHLFVADQAALAQQFCAYFYNQYCISSGDKRGDEVNGGSQSDSTESKQQLPHKLGDSSQKKSKMKTTCPSLCPFFFTGSIFEAIKLCERPPQRPWPAILLYLHHRESPHTLRFAHDILCSQPEYDDSDCEHQDGKIPEVVVDDLLTPDISFSSISQGFHQTPQKTDTLVDSKCSSYQSGSHSPSQKPSSNRGTLGRTEQYHSDNFSKLSPIKRTLFRAASASMTSPKVSRYLDSPLSTETPDGHKTISAWTNTLQENPPRDQQKKSDSNNASYSKLFPEQPPSSGSVEHAIDETNLQSSSDQPDRTQNPDARSLKSGNQDQLEIIRAKSFRALLLERSSGLVPWDCSHPRSRAYLASAFAGTLLVQWLEMWKTPDHYPVLVAIGRTAERDVVCSHLKGSNATRSSALRWLNQVTTAHFANYRREKVPVCPERGERYLLSSFSPGDGSTLQQISPQTAINSGGKSTAITSARTTAITGELTEHTFISTLSIRGTTIETNTQPRVNGQKPASSPMVSEEWTYRVTKTPQIHEDELSLIFEKLVEKPVPLYHKQLKNVQISFKLAVKSLAKATTLPRLRAHGIPINPSVSRALVEPNKAIPPRVLVSILCNAPARGHKVLNTPNALETLKLPSTPKCDTPKFQKLPDGSRSSSRLSSIDPNRDERFSLNTDFSSRDSPCFRTSTKKQISTNRDFYGHFREKFVMDFPTSPPFLLGQLRTALLRCFDLSKNQQIAPLLIYLHDGQAPGIVHFVANVLCSRRFTTKLFDHNIHIWPFDVTGVHNRASAAIRIFGRNSESPKIQKQLKVRNTKASMESVVPGNAQQQNGNTAADKEPWLRPWMRSASSPSNPTKKSHSRNSTFDSPITMDLSSDNHNRHSSGCEVSENAVNLHEKELPEARLLDYFDAHPAKETLSWLLKIPILPTLINLSYHRKTFAVTHILLPSATTKEALTWLNTVLKIVHRQRDL